MKKKTKTIPYRGLALTLALLAGLAALPTFASTSSKLGKTKSEIDRLKEEQEKAKDQVDDLTDKSSGLQSKVDTYNSKLESLSQKMSETKASIDENSSKQEELKLQIKKTNEELDEAKENANQQLASMEDRIRFIYENGRQSYLTIFLESKSIADFLNRMEYVSSINRYDRNQLDAYENTIEEIADLAESLKTDQSQLKQKQEQLKSASATYEKQQEQMDDLVKETKTQLASSKEDLSKAKENEADVKEQLKQMKAKEKALEEKAAKEEAARMEEIKKEEKQSTKGNKITASASDEELLSVIIYCEARGESYKSKLAVASVVVNRVASSKFPNTVSGVIYQKGQFSPVGSGIFAYYLANEKNDSYKDCKKAAKEILNNGSQYSYLYFRTVESAKKAGISGTVIDHMIFY